MPLNFVKEKIVCEHDMQACKSKYKMITSPFIGMQKQVQVAYDHVQQSALPVAVHMPQV